MAVETVIGANGKEYTYKKKKMVQRTVYFGADPNNPKMVRRKTFRMRGKTAKEANAKIDAKVKKLEELLISEAIDRLTVEPEDPYKTKTFNDMTEEFMLHFENNKRGVSYYSTVSSRWDRLVSYLGTFVVRDLTDDMVKALIDSLQASEVPPKTIQVLFNLLIQFIKWNVDNKKAIRTNPILKETKDRVNLAVTAEETTLRSNKTAEQKQTENLFDMAEADDLKKLVYDTNDEMIILACMELMTRPSEAYALHYEDFTEDYLSINKSFKRVDPRKIKGTGYEKQYGGATYVIGAPKNRAAFRDIPLCLCPRLKEIVASWYEEGIYELDEDGEIKLAKDGTKVRKAKFTGLITTTRNGTIMTDSNFSRTHFLHMKKALGLKYITSPKMLRKYGATYQAQIEKLDPSTLIKYIGHSDYKVTTEYYNRLMIDSRNPDDRPDGIVDFNTLRAKQLSVGIQKVSHS